MEEMDLGPDILTLEDDEGQEHQFEVLDTLDLDGAHYLALIPVFDEAQDMLDDDAELVILKTVEEDGEEFLEAIDNEEEFNRVSELFMKSLEEQDYTIEQ